MKRRPAGRVDFRHFCLIVPCDHRTILVFFSTFVLRIRDFLFFFFFLLEFSCWNSFLILLHSFFLQHRSLSFRIVRFFFHFLVSHGFKKQNRKQTGMSTDWIMFWFLPVVFLFFSDCRVLRDPATGKSKGYGFVSFESKLVRPSLSYISYTSYTIHPRTSNLYISYNLETGNFSMNYLIIKLVG